jgi:hypothetical protein
LQVLWIGAFDRQRRDRPAGPPISDWPGTSEAGHEAKPRAAVVVAERRSCSARLGWRVPPIGVSR